MSNSNQMTFEEKMVQAIKEEKVYSMIGDEDAITELVKRAVTEALTAPTRIKNGYHTDEKPSPIMVAAREVATGLVDAMVKDMIELVKSDPEVRKAVMNAAMAQLPLIMQGMVKGAMDSSFIINANENMDYLSSVLRGRMG